MFGTKKIAALALALAILLVLAGCGGGGSAETTAPEQEVAAAQVLSGKNVEEDEIKIAYIPISTAGQTNTIILQALNDVLVVYPNVELFTFDPQYDVNSQITMINEAITQEYDAIILQCVDPSAVSSTVTDAENAGIPVITIGVGCDAVHTLHFRGADYQAGWIAGEEVANRLNNEGNVVILDVPAAFKATAVMGTAFSDYIEQNTNITILDAVPIENWSQENANTAMRDLLTKYDNIDAVYSASDDMAVGAVQAIDSVGRGGEIVVWGTFGQYTTFELIRSGDLSGTCYFDLYGQYTSTMYMILSYIASGTSMKTVTYEQTPTILMTVEVVTQDNVEAVFETSRWKLASGG